MHFTRNAVVACLALLLAIIGAATAAAQDLRIRARSASGGVVKAQRWTPVVVDLETSRPSFQGELVVTFGDTVLRRALLLPSSGTRQFELYLRTENPGAAIRINVESMGSSLASTELPVRVLPFDERVTLCVTAGGGALPEATCTSTTTADKLPRSLRGYAAIDDVALPGSNAGMSDDQRRALLDWRAFRALETSGDLALAPRPSRPVLNRGLPLQSTTDIKVVGGLYLTLIISVAVVATRRTWPVSATWMAFGTAIATGTGATYAVGRLGPGGTVQTHIDSVLSQIPGTNASYVALQGVLELPALDEYLVQLRIADGSMETASGGRHTRVVADADGLPSIRGTYGLGARQPFAAEGILDGQPLTVSVIGRTVTVKNRSGSTLADCRFADGFSKSEVGSLAPNAVVSSEQLGDVLGPTFTCTARSPLVELTSTGRSVAMDGDTLIAIYDRAPGHHPGGVQ